MADIEITHKMIASGLSVLKASSYGSEIRFETDEDLIARIFVVMLKASGIQPKEGRGKSSDLPAF